MRVLVCGGREFDDWDLFISTMDSISDQYDFDNNQPITIIAGGAKGADFCARLYAKYCGWNYLEFPAEWDKYGKAAGGIRNRRMAKEHPDLVVAFPGGKGTQNMIDIAKEKFLPLIEVK